MRLPRRELLKLTAAAAAGSVVGCGSDSPADPVRSFEDNLLHALPTVSSDRILLKTSFIDALSDEPELFVDGIGIRGQMTDSEAQHFAFDVSGLEPDRQYELDLRVGNTRQAEPWTLRTFPARDAEADSVRILAFTCAGGHEAMPIHLSTSVRRRMLQRGLSFSPDFAIALGDHVYWDLTLGVLPTILGNSDLAREIAGTFDRSSPVLGTDNEAVLKRAVDNQIAELYGTLFRSVPVFFVRDDHDYFENDEYREGAGGEPAQFTFPPSDFSVELARATQLLYYPEFLPDPTRPGTLPGTGAADRGAGLSEAFGTIRYGKLLEALLYDCKGFVSLDGQEANYVPADVEDWLVVRMRDSDAAQLFNVPSSPVGFSAGKFLEWYPDVLVDGALTDEAPKAGWQSGWLAQHDRLLIAASAMNKRPIFLGGDIHSHAETHILRSGEHDFSTNPIASIIAGTPGTFGLGWPSSGRGTVATPSVVLEVDEKLPALEENGFNIIDVTPDTTTVRSFRFNGELDDPSSIDTLEPFREVVLPRTT